MLLSLTQVFVDFLVGARIFCQIPGYSNNKADTYLYSHGLYTSGMEGDKK